MRCELLGRVVLLLLITCTAGMAQDGIGLDFVSALDYWPTVNDIQMVGNLAYLTGGESGLHIMDLTDPASPVEIGRYTWYPLDGATSQVFVDGGRAYLTVGGDQSQARGTVLDVSDPTHPTFLGEWDVPISLSDILVVGNIGLERTEYAPTIIDVSDPANIHDLGYIPGLGGLYVPIGIVWPYAYITGFTGLSIWDISDPAVPLQVAAIDTQFIAYRGVLAGNYIYLPTLFDGTRVIDVSNPLQPVEIAVCGTGQCSDVALTGALAVVSKNDDGLEIWNVSDPANPILTGTVSQAWFGRIATSGTLLCAHTGETNASVSVWSISNPAAPTLVGSFGPEGALRCVEISGAAGYLGDGHVGLRTMNLTDPTHPIELANTAGHSNGVVDMAVGAATAYLAEDQWGLRVFDVSNPAQPESLTTWRYLDPTHPISVAVGEGYLYVRGRYNPAWIFTFDLQNPGNPVLVDSVQTSGIKMVVADGRLYTVGPYDFEVYSLTDPAAPQLAGSFNLPYGAGRNGRDLALAGSFAYVADLEGGVRILDVSDPTSILEVGTIPGRTTIVVTSGSTLITNDEWEDEIRVWDLGNPAQPSLVGFYTTKEHLGDMQIMGPYLCTGSMTRFTIYQVDNLTDADIPPASTPREFALYLCYPNPFNASTIISYVVPVATHVELKVFDTLGRTVTVLVDAMRPAGAYETTWTGMTDNGTLAASGLYIYQIKAGSFTDSKKMLLLK